MHYKKKQDAYTPYKNTSYPRIHHKRKQSKYNKVKMEQ